ncbi:MAG TPA: hypothetical protein VIJ88_00855, partial [Candidatus Paceibacterota bacterium]
VIFQGASYNADDDANEYLPIQTAGLTLSGIHEVVFAEFSGDATPAGAIILSGVAGRVATTTIGGEGQIISDK